MQQVRKVGVLSAAKIMGLVYGLMSLVFLPFFFLIMMAASLAEPQQSGPGVVMVAVMSIMMPFFYAAAGFVMGALGAFLYNAVAGWVGGIELELGPLGVMTVPVQREVV